MFINFIPHPQVSPGGSLANSLVAIARLARAKKSAVNVSMAGCLGTDALGQYFNAQLGQAGVSVISNDDAITHTGTVMVSSTRFRRVETCTR